MLSATSQPEDPQEDLQMDALNAIRERMQSVQSMIARGSLGIVGLRLCVNLLRLRREFGRIGRAISAAEVRTEDDRRVLVSVAQRQQNAADVLSACRDQFAGIRRAVPLRGVVMHLFGALVITAEDVAETAALGASAEFADFVKENLKRHDHDAATVNA